MVLIINLMIILVRNWKSLDINLRFLQKCKTSSSSREDSAAPQSAFGCTDEEKNTLHNQIYVTTLGDDGMRDRATFKSTYEMEPHLQPPNACMYVNKKYAT